MTYLCYSFFVAIAIDNPERSISDETRWNLLQRKAQRMQAGRAFELFRKHEIEPILIKGLAAGVFYPDEKLRSSVDLDIAVAAGNFEKAVALAASEAAIGLAIDLHRELRHLDTVDWEDLFDNSRMMETEFGKIRVLRPEDHLRVLCLHWLTDGGTNKDRLWDIYYAIANRPDGFDWDRFLNTVSVRRRRWLICTIGLAQRYLGLDLQGTPIEAEASDLPAWLPRAVERAWTRQERVMPLQWALADPKLFIAQAAARFRLNPIAATVQMEGSFDAPTRLFYRIGNFFNRLMPSYKRVSRVIVEQTK